MPNDGEQFLHREDPTLHTSPPVIHEVDRLEKRGEEVENKPADEIYAWLKKVEEIHQGHREDPAVFERIKEYYYDNYVIKPENVPEEAFLLEQKIARQLGHGTIEITEESKDRKREEIINDQKSSLGRWIDYLSSKDAQYPMWAKYWAFCSVLRMGKFERVEKGEGEVAEEYGRFQKRDETTVSPFPALNPAALAQTISAITSWVESRNVPKSDRNYVNPSKKLKQGDYEKLLSTKSFSRLYAQFLIESPVYSKEGLEEIRGEWRKYPQNSDPKPLVDSLDGYPLEWCTRGIETARGQLEEGDFHVYYSLNENGEANIPRVAIRMEGDHIAEIRGIAPKQNTDPYISPVVEKKLEEFPDGNEYKKKVEDMKRMTDIETRINKGEELCSDDLRFLYEFDSKIQGFGYEKDPRIAEVLAGRDVRSDLALITGFSQDEISLTQEEALRGGIKFHYGDLDLSNLTSALGITLPQTVMGNLDIRSLIYAEDLVLPQTVIGNLGLKNLVFAEGLVLPQTVRGNLDLKSLISAKGLVLPQIVDGLDLRSLISAEGLVLPQIVNFLDLGSLISAEGLVLPQNVDGLDLRSLTSAEGLILPQIVNNLDLRSLISAEGLVLPRTVRDLFLNSLISAKDVVLPQIADILALSNLTSAEGLVLPQKVNNLYLDSLTSIEGLILPQAVRNLFLKNLPQEEKELLRMMRPDIKIW